MLAALADCWSLFVIRGVLAILAGALAIAWPGLTLLMLAALFAVMSFADGIASLWLGLSHHNAGGKAWPYVITGILGLAAGIAAVAFPGVTLLALLYLVAGWSIARGILDVVGAIKLRKLVHDEWAMGVAGVLSVVFGVLLVAWPAAGLLTLAWMVAAFAIAFGVVSLNLGLRLRRLRRETGVPRGTARPAMA
ncbi:MAG: DUF308 domain-containing protein [Myxococcota bacterium]